MIVDLGDCLNCSREAETPFRNYFCSKSCWYSFHKAIWEGGVPKNFYHPDEGEEPPKKFEEPCTAYMFPPWWGVERLPTCNGLIDKDHIFNVEWCSYECFFYELHIRECILEYYQNREKKELEEIAPLEEKYNEAKRNLENSRSQIRHNDVLVTKLGSLKNEINKDFYSSEEWRILRYAALKKHGRKCALCGRTPKDGAKLHVDHIKPRSKHPRLALSLSNLQVLCADCNLGKGAHDETDFREEAKDEAPA